MARSRDDHREAILAKLQEHGGLQFAQLMAYLQISYRHELDYDLRCLRKEGKIMSIPGGVWVLTS